ncbi:MAG: Na(+)/H(+) antiporter subunit D, partial [Pseudomonadota bacterium]|nr:Na(+)/H(+) antiporter subunit D [Pseudomonadota bacterium]
MMSDLLTSLPPGALMMIVAAGLVFVPHHARQMVMLLAIAGSAFSLTAGAGMHLNVEVLGFEMALYRADHLSLPFA